MHYLYKITNQFNGKVYIGQSKEETGRWKQHKYFAKNPEKTGQYIHRAMAKYGIDNFQFEILAVSKSQKDADETEIILIHQYDSRNKEHGYNIKPGGDTWDDEMRQHMSEKIKQHYQNHPEERERVSAQAKEFWQNPDHIAMMKSVPHPNKIKGKTISEEQRLSIIEGLKHLKGVKRGSLSEEHKASISNTRKNFSQERKEEIYNSINVSRGQIVLSKEQKKIIANDPRSSHIIANEYGVNASTIQRIKKKNKP